MTQTATSEAIQTLLNDLKSATYPATSALEKSDDEAVIIFTLIIRADGQRWFKGVPVNPHSPSAGRDAIVAINEWKRQTELQLKFAQPSDSLLHALATFGADAVKEALRQWPTP